MGSMHVAKITSRQKGREYVSWLVRQSYRDQGKVKHRTLANLSALPEQAIDAVQRILKGEPVIAGAPSWEIQRSLPHGHVQAVLEMAGRLGLAQLIDSRSSRQRDLVLAMVLQRVLEPASKLATTRLWQQSTLATELSVQDANEDELYGAMDWLLKRQSRIEDRLAGRHLSEGGLVLYDLSSSYMEGRHCSLARIGYSRDGKRGTLQIEYGMITDAEGRPVAIEVFEGNLSDPRTVAGQVDKVRGRFRLAEVVLVSDRGMLTQARIDELAKQEGVAWISALRGPAIRELVESGSLQLSLFDERNLAEISSPEYPGERLVVCKNPLLAQERARKREDLLRATEAKLGPIQERVAQGKLTEAGKIGVAVGKVINQHKVGKHFEVEIADGRLRIARKEPAIAEEAALDGIYVLRTSVSEDRLPTAEVVRSYKRLSKVERAFRSLKSIDHQIRPVHHYSDDRVRAHVFLCMLAYYLRWHLEQAWAPLLFKDEEPPLAEDPVAPARRSAAAQLKASSQRLPDGTPAHSLRTLLRELATLTRNRVRALDADGAEFEMLATPTSLQARALALIGSKTHR
jgi:Transposase DDE domain